MKLLALDQATRLTGYAVFEDDKLVTYGLISATQEDIGERLHYIRIQVALLIDKYEIDEVIMEDIQLQNNIMNNVQTFKALAEVFGVLYELFVELKMPRHFVLASSWKSVLNIKGSNRTTQKRNAQEWVANTYGIQPTQDQADAICIGAYYLKKNNEVVSFDWAD